MPNIKPISDLRNYTDVLHEVAVGEPVFLTKNGRGKFVIVDLSEYDKMKASLKLMAKLEEGEHSVREEGCLPDDEDEVCRN